MRYGTFVLALLLTACATGPRITSQNVNPDVRTDTLEASYSKTVDAIMSAYSAKGFGVDKVNESAGLIKSGWKQSGNIVGSKARSQFSAQVSRIDSTATQVRLTMTAQRRSLGEWSAVSMPKQKAESFYTDAFSTFRDHL